MSDAKLRRVLESLDYLASDLRDDLLRQVLALAANKTEQFRRVVVVGHRRNCLSVDDYVPDGGNVGVVHAYEVGDLLDVVLLGSKQRAELLDIGLVVVQEGYLEQVVSFI